MQWDSDIKEIEYNKVIFKVTQLILYLSKSFIRNTLFKEQILLDHGVSYERTPLYLLFDAASAWLGVFSRVPFKLTLV